MKYILKAVSLRHKEDEDPYYGLDPQYIPEGARIELVETRWFGEKKAKIKQWVIDIATVEDIANAVYYFGSDESRNTTGAELTVDGGNMIQLYPIIPE